MTIRFHLDEQVHPAIAVGLRARGIDVTTTADAALASSADTEHLAFAFKERRVLVTHDHDFLRHHAAGLQHFGIAYCHQEKYAVGDLLQMLLLLHACYSAEQFRGCVEYL